MRTISESTTRLPEPVILCNDRARAYQLRPIPGQLTLDVPQHQTNDEWVRAMVAAHGHCGQ